MSVVLSRINNVNPPYIGWVCAIIYAANVYLSPVECINTNKGTHSSKILYNFHPLISS